MICTKCGKELHDGLKFCTGCGAQLWTPGTPVLPAAEKKPEKKQNAPEEKPAKEKKERPAREPRAPKEKPAKAPKPPREKPAREPKKPREKPAKGTAGAAKRPGRGWLAAAAAVLLAAALLAAAGLWYTSRYRQAAALAQEDRFAEAHSTLVLPGLTALHDALLPGYIDAGLALDSGSLIEAQAAFEAMDGYRQARRLEQEARYRQAHGLMDAGSYAEAHTAYEALAGYADAVQLALKARFLLAGQLLEQKDFDGAIGLYRQLAQVSYPQASQLAQEALYRKIEYLLLEQRNVSAGLPLLTPLLEEGDERAAQIMEQARPIIYEDGLHAYGTGAYSTAEARLALVPGYEQSEGYLLLCQVHRQGVDSYAAAELAELLLPLVGDPGLADAEALLYSSSDALYEALVGNWAENGEAVLRIYASGSIRHRLPDVGGGQYEIVDGTLYMLYESHPACWSFDFISPNELDVYCHADGSTHRLQR